MALFHTCRLLAPEGCCALTLVCPSRRPVLIPLCSAQLLVMPSRL